MASNPLNLAIRFLLELAALVVFGYWGWHMGEGWLRLAGAITLPVVAAAIWGIFRIPNDPKPAPVEVSGRTRLLIEFIYFGSAAWMLYRLQYTTLSIIMAVIVLLHYIVSYDRTWAMLRNKKVHGS